MLTEVALAWFSG